MLASGPLIAFIIAALLTPVLNYMVVPKPEAVYEEQISSLSLETKGPFYAVNLNENPFYLTGVVERTHERGEKRPALKVALLDGKFDEIQEE